MNIESIRIEMVRCRLAAESEAKERKDTYLVMDRLRQLYLRLDASEQKMAENILAEWALSEDPNVRFDALLLINEYDVRSALPSLHSLALRLKESSDLGILYEQKKVIRLIEKLASPDTINPIQR